MNDSDSKIIGMWVMIIWSAFILTFFVYQEVSELKDTKLRCYKECGDNGMYCRAYSHASNMSDRDDIVMVFECFNETVSKDYIIKVK